VSEKRGSEPVQSVDADAADSGVKVQKVRGQTNREPASTLNNDVTAATDVTDLLVGFTGFSAANAAKP
jgi:hypothetical protein